MPRVGLAVHTFFPHIGGSEAHVRWMAGALRDRGFSPLVITRRADGEPMTVDGIEISTSIADAVACDVVLTYSASALTLKVGAVLRGAGRRRPGWVHHPCAVGRFGRELIRAADCILAFNSRDVELALEVCGRTKNVVRAFPGAHEERKGRPGRFRHQIGCEYVLWIGAWSRAKGARIVSERFARLRDRYPALPVKLVMFGAHGADERPISHPDIVVVDGNWDDVPDALADCAFLAFNSPGPPVGYDANPIVLLEALLNGKTFVAQSGTPFVCEIGDLGLVVNTDNQWVEAAHSLLVTRQRWELEQACAAAFRSRYNLTSMMDSVEGAIQLLLER
jgi:glycosyltransferase involved in cell wall biosynthesis